jgi:hypothetical protein
MKEFGSLAAALNISQIKEYQNLPRLIFGYSDNQIAQETLEHAFNQFSKFANPKLFSSLDRAEYCKQLSYFFSIFSPNVIKTFLSRMPDLNLPEEQIQAMLIAAHVACGLEFYNILSSDTAKTTSQSPSVNTDLLFTSFKMLVDSVSLYAYKLVLPTRDPKERYWLYNTLTSMIASTENTPENNTPTILEFAINKLNAQLLAGIFNTLNVDEFSGHRNYTQIMAKLILSYHKIEDKFALLLNLITKDSLPGILNFSGTSENKLLVQLIKNDVSPKVIQLLFSKLAEASKESQLKNINSESTAIADFLANLFEFYPFEKVSTFVTNVMLKDFEKTTVKFLLTRANEIYSERNPRILFPAEGITQLRKAISSDLASFIQNSSAAQRNLVINSLIYPLFPGNQQTGSALTSGATASRENTKSKRWW